MRLLHRRVYARKTTMLTRRRRRQCLPHWLELEPGVWEKIFCQLDQDSLRGARLVCKAWNDTACRGIKSLRIELRTGPLMLYRTRSTGVPTLIKEVGLVSAGAQHYSP